MSFRFKTASILLLLLIAGFISCSKKENKVTTYVLDKTTSTTGTYEGLVHVENGLATQGQPAPVIPACHPDVNTLVPTDVNVEPSMTFYPPYTSSDRQFTASSPHSDIYITFYHDLPVTDYIYTTSGTAGTPQQISIILKTKDGMNWTADGGQKIYAKVTDPVKRGVSITLCNIKFTSYTFGTSSFTADGNFTYN